MNNFIDGKIDLSFFENLQHNGKEFLPLSYYTLSSKERLILLVAEAFRLKFITNYPTRRPLLLAPKNECDVQVFIYFLIFNIINLNIFN